MARLAADEDDIACLPGDAGEAFAAKRRQRASQVRGGGGSKVGAMPATAAEALAALALAYQVFNAQEWTREPTVSPRGPGA